MSLDSLNIFANGFRALQVAAEMEKAGFEKIKELHKDYRAEFIGQTTDNVGASFMLWFAAEAIAERCRQNLEMHSSPEASAQIRKIAINAVQDLNKIQDFRDFDKPYTARKPIEDAGKRAWKQNKDGVCQHWNTNQEEAAQRLVDQISAMGSDNKNGVAA